MGNCIKCGKPTQNIVECYSASVHQVESRKIGERHYSMTYRNPQKHREFLCRKCIFHTGYLLFWGLFGAVLLLIGILGILMMLSLNLRIFNIRNPFLVSVIRFLHSSTDIYFIYPLIGLVFGCYFIYMLYKISSARKNEQYTFSGLDKTASLILVKLLQKRVPAPKTQRRPGRPFETDYIRYMTPGQYSELITKGHAE